MLRRPAIRLIEACPLENDRRRYWNPPCLSLTLLTGLLHRGIEPFGLLIYVPIGALVGVARHS